MLDPHPEAPVGDNAEQRIVTAREQAIAEERQRLARDLHDSVTQSLYSITLRAMAAQRSLAVGDVATAMTNLLELQSTAQEALDEMRLLIFELRPPVLEQVGLAAALQARLQAVEGRANLQTKLSVDDLDGLPSVIEHALYRISQEALNNILKHAHAHSATVHVRRRPGTVTLEIVDDGVGFEVAVARQTGGVGLSGIVERVAQLGAEFTVQSTPGAGTALRVEIKL